MEPAEAFSLFLLRHLPRQKSRVPDQAPAQHDPLRLRKFRQKRLHAVSCKQVSVIADRRAALPLRQAVLLQIRRIIIIILLHPRVHDQFLQGIPVENLQKPWELLRALHAKTRLHRDPKPSVPAFSFIQFRKHGVEKAVQLLWKRQETGALPFAHDRPGGAAQVQVDLPVPEVLERSRKLQEALRPVRQDLRHHKEPSVILRQNFLELPFFEAALFMGLQKRGEILIQSAVYCRLGVPVHISGDALHGGKISFYRTHFSALPAFSLRLIFLNTRTALITSVTKKRCKTAWQTASPTDSFPSFFPLTMAFRP